MKKLLLLISFFFAYNCSDNSVSSLNDNDNSSKEDFNDQEIFTNTISKLMLKGDSLFIFTPTGYSVVPSLSNMDYLYSFENDITDGFNITHFVDDNHVYNGYVDEKNNTINTKTFLNGNLYDETVYDFIIKNKSISAIVEIAPKSDTIYGAMLYSGMLVVADNQYYMSLIDTVANNLIPYPTAPITDTNHIFYPKNYNKYITSNPKNNVNGVKILNNQIIAQTWDGIYTSKDGDVWKKNEFMAQKAKECIESSFGVVNGKDIFYSMYRTKQNHVWDTLYTGETQNHGLYVSDDNLETFTYFPKFKDKIIGGESFIHMSSHKDKIIIATTDSVYAGVYNGISFSWQSMGIKSTMANSINSVAINDSMYFLGSENAGVLYSKDFKNWEYIIKSKSVETDLKEIYAFPSKITRINAKTTFAYSIAQIDSVTIEIFDYNNDLIKTIIKDKSRKQGTILEKSTNTTEDIWDGTDSKNRFVKPGNYRFKISTKYGKKSAWGRVTVGVLK